MASETPAEAPPRGRRRTRTRRTQAERSAATRERLLDAALETLVERGYAGTTTVEVAQRAGLSRGAHLHHFHTKSELLAHAIAHLFERRIEEFRRAVAAFPAGTDVVSASLDLLWSMFSDPTAYAMLELAVAARSDPELRETLRPFAGRFAETLARTSRELLPGPLHAHPRLRAVRSLTVHLMQGMAVARIVDDDPEDRQRVLELLKDIGRGFLADAVAGDARTEAAWRG